MNKFFVVGVDGSTWDTLRPWMDEGLLPLFKRLVDGGISGVLKSTIPSLTCPALPSFYTGNNPTKTKVFSFRDQHGKIISFNDVEGERFWDALPGRSFVSGVVTTYPAYIQNGVMVSDAFLVTGDEYAWPLGERESFPSFHWMSLVVDRSEMLRWQKKDREKLFEHYMSAEEERFEETLSYLVSHPDFDFKLVYFIASDRIQHLLWDNQNLILECYQRIERMIQKLLDLYPDHNFILFSDHGFGPSPKIAFYINQWLEENHLLQYKSTWSKLKENLYKKAYYSGGWTLEKYLPIQAYEKMQKLLKKTETTNEHFTVKIEPLETNPNILRDGSAYLSQKWGIKLNYEIRAEVSNIITKMKELEYKGAKVFTEVYAKEELYPGSDDIKEVPEIIFVTNPLFEVRTGSGWTLFRPIVIKRRQEGSHDNQRDGILIANGPDIKTGKVDASLLDLAPTILSAYAIEREMDGKKIDLFKEEK
jgi:predicted AlkP superfamily phosphohydrolase/phosphomutase